MLHEFDPVTILAQAHYSCLHKLRTERLPHARLRSFILYVKKYTFSIMGCSAAKKQVSGPVCASWLVPVSLDKTVSDKYMCLSQNGKVQAEYVWVDSDFMIDGRSFDILSKSMTLPSLPKSIEDLPIWDYGNDKGKDVKLVPRRIYKCPFRGGDNILVLAERG